MKEVKADLRDFRSNLTVLNSDVHRIDIGLAELRAEFRFAKWLLGLSLIATLGGIGSGIWWAGNMNSNMRNAEIRADERFKAMDARFERLEKSIDVRFERLEKSIDVRFEKLETFIIKVIEPMKPKP